ncbi:MAG: DUF432 domain-containing protein [Desulfurococcales archaeon]|nr:DUF432 domain-containing protein [Desulfurococcales archaeon]
MVYGRLDPGGEVRVGGYVLRISRGPMGMLEYSRLRDGEQVASAYIYHSRDVRLIPARPMLLPERGLASCLMIDFERPVHIPPFSSVNLEARIIVDLAVVTIEGRRHSLVDAFEPGVRPKLAFYGQGPRGVLCRYTRGILAREPGPGYAETRVSIVNNSEDPVRVSTIVVPLSRMRMYYRPGTWRARASDIVMAIRGPDSAVVNVENPRLGERMEASPLAYMGREIAILPTGFLMEWGF